MTFRKFKYTLFLLFSLPHPLILTPHTLSPIEMAPIDLYKLCPNSSTNTSLSSLMQCSVDRSLHYSTNLHHEKSVVYFTLLSFCLGLTLFYLACIEVILAFINRFVLPHALPATVRQNNPDSITTSKLLPSNINDMELPPGYNDRGFVYEEEDLEEEDKGDYMHREYMDFNEEVEEEEAVYEHVVEPIMATCAYCFDNIYDEPINPCSKCKRVCCAECMRAIFLLACRDESSMPPRCCRRPIPLAYGRLVLSNEEVQVFRDKYDEWITAERCYCPVPSCSAFLSPRVFPLLRQGQGQGQGQSQSQDQDQDQTEDEDVDIVREREVLMAVSESFYASDEFDIKVGEAGHAGVSEYQGSGNDTRPVIHCPECSTAICVQCIQLAHDDDRECSRDDEVTPELAEALVALRAKRCPKCRTAVRKSHGCSQMRCRCGAKWCWYCFRSVDECEDEPCVVVVEGADFHGEMYSSDESDNDHHHGHGHGHGDDGSSMTLEYNTDDEKEVGDGDMEDVITSRIRYPPDVYQRVWQAAVSQNNFSLMTSDADRRTEQECRVVPFNCLHKWYPVEDFESEASLTYDCERCWGQVYARLTDIPVSELPDAGLLPVQRELVADGEASLDYDIMQDHIMFRCWFCNQTICNKCRKGE